MKAETEKLLYSLQWNIQNVKYVTMCWTNDLIHLQDDTLSTV